MVDKYKLTTSVAIFLDESSSSCDTGEIYMKKLANFVEKRLESERTASVSFTLVNTYLFTFIPSKVNHFFQNSIASILHSFPVPCPGPSLHLEACFMYLKSGVIACWLLFLLLEIVSFGSLLI